MNKRIIKAAHIVAVGIILLVGLVIVAWQVKPTSGQTQNSNSSANRNTSSGSTASGQASGLSSPDRQFAMDVAMDGMTEVELGRLATQQGASDSVKQFGQRMVDDHTKANNDLMQWASTSGVTLPTTLDAKHQAMVTKMTALSGAAFDKAYAKSMVSDHTKAVAMFQKEADKGSDSGLKSFAATTLPTLQEHLTMARALSTGNGNGSTNASTNSSMNANMGGSKSSGKNSNKSKSSNSNMRGNANNSNQR
jgi:putative membrane protein